MNKELLYAAHQLHGMIKIKDEELIDPRGSYPRIAAAGDRKSTRLNSSH